MKRIITILGIILAAALTFYTVAFFSISEETLIGEIENAARENGLKLNVEEANKEFPFTVVFRTIALRFDGLTQPISLPRASISFSPLMILGGKPFNLIIYDEEGDFVKIKSETTLKLISIAGRNFDLSSPDEEVFPSISVENISATFEKIVETDEKVEFRGRGKFKFYRVTLAYRGIPFSLSNLRGEFFLKNGSVYLQNTEGVLMGSRLILEGTVRLRDHATNQLFLDVTIIDPSPVISKFLNLSLKHGNKLKITVRGTLSSPVIRKVGKGR